MLTQDQAQTIIQIFIQEFQDAQTQVATAQAAFNSAQAAINTANDRMVFLNSIKGNILQFGEVQAALSALNITLP